MPFPQPATFTQRACILGNESNSSGTLINVTLQPSDLIPFGALGVLTGIDWSTSAEISNTFIAQAMYNTTLFFAETQTFAAGRGVSQWRGAIPFTPEDTLGLYLNVSFAAQIGVIAWGYYLTNTPEFLF